MKIKELFSLRIGSIGFAIVTMLGATALPAWSQPEQPTAVDFKKLTAQYRENGTSERTLLVRDVPQGAAYPALPAALPAEVNELITRYQQQQNLATMNVIRELQAMQQRYTTQGMQPQAAAIAARIAQLQQTLGPAANSAGALPDPGNLTAYRDRAGQSFVFQVVGKADAGTVWGSDLYTDDSSLAAAAVHAGVLRAGESGNVRVDLLPGQASYTGATRNGVTSFPYQAWSASYRVSRASDSNPSAASSLTEYRGRNGEILVLDVTGNSSAGTIWGGDFNVYTDDSALAAAAVHAGILKDGEHGKVKVTIMPGRDYYPAIKRPNGVESQSWNAWGGSYKVEAADIEPRSAGGAAPGAPVIRFTIDPVLGGGLRNDGVNISSFRGKKDATILISVVGSTEGTVWGSDVYTDDSSVAAAAVHAGLLKVGEQAILKVNILPGRAEYPASDRNGVSSHGYGAWEGSFSLEKTNFGGKSIELESLRGETWQNFSGRIDKLQEQAK